METIGVYWAFTFGNHEAREEKGRFKELIMKCQTAFPHCLARQGREDLFGLCNYCVNILKGEDELLKTLFMFDSGRDILDEYRAEQNVPPEIGCYDYLKKSQMNCYIGIFVVNLHKHIADLNRYAYFFAAFTD